MQTAKVFINGRSQAVRLPKSCRFAEDDVYVKKFEDIVILIPKSSDKWGVFMHSLDNFSDDFMIAREQPEEQQRNLP